MRYEITRGIMTDDGPALSMVYSAKGRLEKSDDRVYKLVQRVQQNLANEYKIIAVRLTYDPNRTLVHLDMRAQ